MRSVRVLLVAIAVAAAGLTVWALADGGATYGTTDPGPAPTVTSPAPAQADPAAPVEPAPEVPSGPDTPASDPTATAPRPRIHGFGSEPVFGTEGGFWQVPPGPGEAILITDATHATKVEFLLTPTGTGTAGRAVTLGVDTDGHDGYTAHWRYQDRPLLAHLTVRATGPGGVTEHVVGVYHTDPAARS